MADEQVKPSAPTASSSDTSQSGPTSGKVTSPAQPQQVSPGSQEGVQVGGLNYTENEDGTRNYPDQKPVQTTGDPTPTPEVNPPEQPSGA